MQAFRPHDPSRRSRPHVNPHIAYSHRRNQSTYVIVGVILVLVAIVAVISLWGGDDTPELILNVVALRKGPTELVKRSALITRTNEIIGDLGSKRIKNEWDGLADCMPKGCTDIDYYNFLVTVITQKKVPHGDLLYNVILVNKYAGTAEIIDFSQATTSVNKGVEELGSREVSKQWNSIVACLQTTPGCAEKDDLFFSMIKMVVMTG